MACKIQNVDAKVVCIKASGSKSKNEIRSQGVIFYDTFLITTPSTIYDQETQQYLSKVQINKFHNSQTSIKKNQLKLNNLLSLPKIDKRQNNTKIVVINIEDQTTHMIGIQDIPTFNQMAERLRYIKEKKIDSISMQQSKRSQQNTNKQVLNDSLLNVDKISAYSSINEKEKDDSFISQIGINLEKSNGDSECQSLVKQLIMPRDIHLPKFWDSNSPQIDKFNIKGNQVTRNSNSDGWYQITSQKPIPHQRIFTIKLQLNKYGGDQSIIFGLITKNRKYMQDNGSHNQTVSYWTYPKFKTGAIFIDRKPVDCIGIKE